MSSRLRRMVDLYWSDSGDFMLDSRDRDLLDTKEKNLQAVLQKIETRLNSSRGDWRQNPQLGATLSRFAGRPNTPEVGAEMETVIKNELVRGGLFSPNELTVQVFPISENALAAFVQVQPAGGRETAQLVISYSLQDNKLSLRN